MRDVVEAADRGFGGHAGAVDDVLLWRGERRLLSVFVCIQRRKSGPSGVHNTPRLLICRSVLDGLILVRILRDMPGLGALVANDRATRCERRYRLRKS